MRLFRSEEEIEAWCAAHARAPGAVLTLDRLQRLAAAWYGDRLRPDWRPRTREESQAVLDAAGLDDPFWRLG
jgi:hypothetical protein